MTSKHPSIDLVGWQQQAHQYFLKGYYTQAAHCYEQAIEAEPNVKSSYWNLGLTLLLQGQEAEAQITWLLAMAEGTAEEIDLWTAELVDILQTEAQRREDIADYSVAWAIRQHIREISPTDIENILRLIQLAIKLDTFTGDELTELGIIELLGTEQGADFDHNLLLQVLRSVLEHVPYYPSALEFAKACLPHASNIPVFVDTLLPTTIDIAYSRRMAALAANIAELFLELKPNHPEVLRQLAGFYQNAHNYSKGIETAKLCYSLVKTLPDKIFANHLILKGLMSAGGLWQEACATWERQESLLLSLIEEEPIQLHKATVLRLLSSTFFFPYFRDSLPKNRHIQNKLTHRCQAYLQDYSREQVERYGQQRLPNFKVNKGSKHLRIGYLSYCLRRHSVGWLARWLFEHHERDSFEIYTYFIGNKYTEDNVQNWYASQVNQAYRFGMESSKVAEQIYEDKIDILIDLDSITLDVSCEVMALKPAPVQATWLGWDASGLPTIDYFIADPYVLPDLAEDYYSEKIWRLPQTYIAVDGFEVGVPTLRRDQLDLPSDAVVYLTAQKGYKRHPDTMRLQMKIIKEVQNSYFFIKGLADEESIKNFCIQMATEESIDCERLRFLPEVELESVHRANLGIADVVLDTYPYNGATTTLETLWMCIPLVTRVGQQFAARNSYTMMMNAGITEGIAWTDEEYIEWGVRLGKDEALRQNIAWKLRQSRQTAPLWNARQFTREMEKAYKQMWQHYIETHQ